VHGARSSAGISLAQRLVCKAPALRSVHGRGPRCARGCPSSGQDIASIGGRCAHSHSDAGQRLRAGRIMLSRVRSGLRTAFPSLSVRRARSALAFFMSRAGLVHSCSPQFYRHPTTVMAGLRVLCAARAHVRVLLCCALFSLFAFCSDCIHREFCTRSNICALCMGWCLHRHTPSMRTDCHMIGKVRFMRQENGCKAQHQFLAFQLHGMLQHR